MSKNFFSPVRSVAGTIYSGKRVEGYKGYRVRIVEAKYAGIGGRESLRKPKRRRVQHY